MIEESVSFVADDGFKLGGTFFAAHGDCALDRAVLISCGGGIASRHYRHFARFLADAGISVLTYDYRGVGESRPPSLRNFPATIEDWSEYDCAAATKWISSRCNTARLTGLGHSVGSLLFGGSRNATLVRDYVMIGPHSGYFGDYKAMYRLPMAILWHVAMPLVTHLFGYFPAHRMRLGDDLPKGVALQWARKRAPLFDLSTSGSGNDRLGRLIAACTRVTGRTLLITFSDDSFATEAGAARVRGYFPKMSFEHWLIRPAEVGLKRIGHFGFFQQKSKDTLWPMLLAYLIDPSSKDDHPRFGLGAIQAVAFPPAALHQRG